MATLNNNNTTLNGYYVSYNGDNYLSANDNYNGYVNQTSINDATLWSIDGNNRLYVTRNNTNYYVRDSARNGSNTIALSDSTNYAFTKSDDVLRYRRGNNYNYYYVYYTGTEWAASTTSRNLTWTAVRTPNTSDATYTVTRTNSGNVSMQSDTPDVSRVNTTYNTKDTYFPLKYEEGDTDVAIGNTGYIVGGSRFFDNSQMISDMRVSRYATSQLKGTFVNGSTGQTSYSNSTRQYFKVLTKTYKTYNDSTYSSNTNNYFAMVADDYNNGTHGATVAARIYNATDATTSSSRNYKYARYDQIGLTKYGDARADLDSTWKTDGSYAYGLHFMNALISESETIHIDKAVINNDTYLKEDDGYYHHYQTVDKTDEHGNVIYENDKPVKETNEVGLMSGAYEMPKDCIDFNLAENATINFFAGTYFSGNNAFFSLHRIFRKNNITTTTIDGETVEVSDANEIDSIKEIHYVYKNTEYSVANRDVPRYIYLFRDGTYGYGDTVIASGSFNTGILGDMLFNTDWITGTSGSPLIYLASYYFEIPAVKGEYALGSVNGKTGAYLMYLDIGAAEISDDIINVNETVTLFTEIFEHPDGIDFCSMPLAENQTFAAIITSETIGTVVVPTGVYGSDISFSLEETTSGEPSITSHTLTCGPPDSSTKLTKSTYIGDAVTMTCNGVKLTAIVDSWTNEVRTISKKYTYSKDELALVITTVYSSVITTDTDPTGTSEGYTETSDPIALEVDDYEQNYKIEANEATGLTSFVEFSYYVLGDADPEVTCEYKCTHSETSYVYTYEFTITTNEDIVVYVDSLITSITQSSNVEIYALVINGVTYHAGDVVIIHAS